MSDDMTGCSMAMMAGMSLVGLLVVIVLVLAIAALAKYLFFARRGGVVEK